MALKNSIVVFLDKYKHIIFPVCVFLCLIIIFIIMPKTSSSSTGVTQERTFTSQNNNNNDSAGYLAGSADFILDWHLIGPFDNTEFAGYETPYPPEKEIDFSKTYQGKHSQVGWKKINRTSQQFIIEGYNINLMEFFKHENWVVAYAYTSINVGKKSHVDFLMGSDDAITCWLNGKQVHTNRAFRGVNRDQDRTGVTLEKGENKILLKIAQGEGGFGYCFRIAEKNGKPFKKFKINN